MNNEYTGPMGKYEVLVAFPRRDENMQVIGEEEVGSVLELPTPVGEQLISEGFVKEVVVEKTPEEEVAKKAEEDRVAAEKEAAKLAEEEKVLDTAEAMPTGELFPIESKKHFAGQEIIREGTRIVNGAEFHSVQIADGSTHDLTDAEYKAKVQ